MNFIFLRSERRRQMFFFHKFIFIDINVYEIQKFDVNPAFVVHTLCKFEEVMLSACG